MYRSRKEANVPQYTPRRKNPTPSGGSTLSDPTLHEYLLLTGDFGGNTALAIDIVPPDKVLERLKQVAHDYWFAYEYAGFRNDPPKVEVHRIYDRLSNIHAIARVIRQAKEYVKETDVAPGLGVENCRVYLRNKPNNDVSVMCRNGDHEVLGIGEAKLQRTKPKKQVELITRLVFMQAMSTDLYPYVEGLLKKEVEDGEFT